MKSDIGILDKSRFKERTTLAECHIFQSIKHQAIYQAELN